MGSYKVFEIRLYRNDIEKILKVVDKELALKIDSQIAGQLPKCMDYKKYKQAYYLQHRDKMIARTKEWQQKKKAEKSKNQHKLFS
jgi:hypothetical protein